MTLVLLILLTFCTLLLPIPTARAFNCGEQEEQTPIYDYHVVNVYPHDPDAFTQGLIYDRGELYEGTGLYGESLLRRVELKTGKILQPPPPKELCNSFFGEGITLWKERLIQLTWQENLGFVYDRDTFDLIDVFFYPTQGWGLTHDNQKIILSDGTDKLYFLNPETYRVFDNIQIREQNTPVKNLNELEYIEGEIFANVAFSNCIARINPLTGVVVGWIDLTGLQETECKADECESAGEPNGIAYDKQEKRIFVTGKNWSYLFEIELVEYQK